MNNTVYSLQYTVNSLYYEQHSVQCTVYSIQYTVNSLHYEQHSVQCTVYNIQYTHTINVLQYTVSSIQ